jgi:hypothetical protein
VKTAQAPTREHSLTTTAATTNKRPRSFGPCPHLLLNPLKLSGNPHRQGPPGL